MDKKVALIARQLADIPGDRLPPGDTCYDLLLRSTHQVPPHRSVWPSWQPVARAYRAFVKHSQRLKRVIHHEAVGYGSLNRGGDRSSYVDEYRKAVSV